MLSPRRRIIAWSFVVVAAVFGGLSTVLVALWLPGAVGSGVAAVAAAVAGIWMTRATVVMSHDDEVQRARGRMVRLDKHGRLPVIGDLDDPVALGVHRAADWRGNRTGGPPTFIGRDIEERLLDAIGEARFVVLVGESTAGKSRTAYEAMRTYLSGHRLVEPVGREAVQVAIEAAVATPRCVLWLDDLERFLGSGGLTSAGIGMVLGASGANRHIMATMRSEEYARFSGRAQSMPDGSSRDAARRGWEVLNLARRLTLARSWSPAEIARADRHRADPRISEALAHADRFGLAEYLAAGPQLLSDWQDGWAPGTHPRGCALVLAAVDARRAGIHRPLPRALLEQVHEPYLRNRGGELLRPEPMDTALAWATTPLHATSSLLLPSEGEGFLAFDYLIDAIDKSAMPAEALDGLISHATPDEAMDIADAAWQWQRLDQADAAFRHAAAGGKTEAALRRVDLIQERDGDAAAYSYARRVLADREQIIGPEHSDTLAARRIAIWETGEADPAAALSLVTQLHRQCRELLGPHDRVTLMVRRDIAHWTAEAGDHAAAARLCTDLAVDCAHALGRDDQLTIQVRISSASNTADAGDPGEAVRILDDLLDDITGYPEDHRTSATTARYHRALRLTQAGDHDKALCEWQGLLTDIIVTRGADSLSLDIRHYIADSLGRSGDPRRAVQLLTQVIAEASELCPPRSRTMLYLGRHLAYWTGRAGSPDDAVRQLRQLTTDSTRQFGETDLGTLNLRRRLANWIGITGDHDEAVHVLDELLAEVTSKRGPNNKTASDIRDSIDYWHRQASDTLRDELLR